MELITIGIILILSYTVPLVITTFNIVNLFQKNPILEKLIDCLTFILGISLSLILFKSWNPSEYYKAIVLGKTSFQLHSPIAFEHMSTILILATIAIIGYLVLRILKNRLSPIIAIISISAIYIGIALSAVFSIQLFNNIFSGKGEVPNDILYMTLFPLNYVLCSIRLIKQVIRLYIERQNKNDISYQNKILQFCQQVLSESIGWYVLAFIIMIPLLCILLIIMVLFGQMPDSFIRAFTETSDWSLSQKVSPPPIKYEGHYLCTVAVNGHKKVVKPTRAGIRHGVKITVNRQLCIANAFEQLIEERTPKLHRIVRKFYDKYGYPISKHITTPLRADIVYKIMKPLEWLFIIVLYIFDINPENRIAMQYTGNHFDSRKLSFILQNDQ
jgi:hypothetical protein